MINYLKNLFKNYLLNNSGIQRHIILAEFPKSGGTYLHSILNTLLSKQYKDVNYSNISTFSNGMDLDMVSPLNYKSVIDNYTRRQILIKTHKKWNSGFQKIICLYREPVAVFKSFYNMKRSYGYKPSSFSEFIRGERGVKFYTNFYESYLNTPQYVRIMFVNYDEVIKSSQLISDILYFTFGILIDKEEINYVQKNNNFNKALDSEIRYEKYDLRRIDNRSIKFVGNKKFNNEIQQKDIEYIKKSTKEIRKKLGF